jgi:leucyl-tRNA synthetase
MSGQTNMGVIMKDLIANKETEEIKKNPDFVQRTIKDILSEPVSLRKTKLEVLDFDEKELIASELAGLVRTDFGVELQVFSESDPSKYDPKNKAKTARPFKPAILIE